MADIAALENKAREIRKTVLNMIYEAKAGHIGGSLSQTDILTALYYCVMNTDPQKPNWDERDRFVLSKGHCVESLWAILADKGFFPKEELATFFRFESRLIGHPNNEVPGVEMNTGSLGHGLSVGVGMALAAKMDDKPYRTFVLMGDGELAEGSLWEGAMAASHYKLGNLIAIVDRNHLQITGKTEHVMGLEPLAQRFLSFGWNVKEVGGHSMTELTDVFLQLPVSDKPHVVIAHTTKGKGISFAENNASWHHHVPVQNEFELATKELEGIL